MLLLLLFILNVHLLYIAPHGISSTMSIRKTSTEKGRGGRREGERRPRNLSAIPMVTSDSDRGGPIVGFFPLEDPTHFLPWAAPTRPGQTHERAHACSSTGSGVLSAVPSPFDIWPECQLMGTEVPGYVSLGSVLLFLKFCSIRPTSDFGQTGANL